MSDNPCLGCQTNCCTSLSSIRVSRDEFDRYFAAYPDTVQILEDGPLLELAMTGGTCPHFEGQCTAYEGRPVDCELFPYTNHRVRAVGPFVVVTYHHRVVCPIRSEILPTEERARELITKLVRDAYGDDCQPILLNEDWPAYRFLRRVYFALTGRGAGWRGPLPQA